MELLITLLVVVFIIWAIYAISGAFPIPQPWRTVIMVIVGAIVLFYLIIPLLRQAPFRLP